MGCLTAPQQVCMYRASLQMAHERQPDCQQIIIAPRPGRLEIDESIWPYRHRRSAQAGLEQARIEWRVQEHKIDTRRWQLRERSNSITTLDTNLLRLQTGLDRRELQHKLAVLLDQQDLGCTTRRRLETQCASACKRIDAGPAAQILPKPVEDSFAYTVGRRPQSGLGGNRQATALPLTTNDAQGMARGPC